MATEITVPYTVAQGDAAADAVTERWPRDSGPQATVRLRCNWAHRHQLMRDLLGVWGVDPPFEYPYSDNLVAIDIVDCRPVGGAAALAGGWPVYETAEVTVAFGVPTYDWPGQTNDPSGEPWITTTFDISGEMLSKPEGSYYWEDSDLPVNDGRIGQFLPSMGLSCKRHWAPSAPIGKWMAKVGTVNSGYVMLGQIFAPPETLLFLAGPIEQSITTLATWSWNCELRFAFRRTSWNKMWHPKPGLGWQYINQEINGTDPLQRIYEVQDFDDLFNF